MDDKVRISQVVYLLFSSVSWNFIDCVKLEKKALVLNSIYQDFLEKQLG